MFGRLSSPATSSGTVWSPAYFTGRTIHSMMQGSTTCSGVWADLLSPDLVKKKRTYLLSEVPVHPLAMFSCS
eukprot:6092795-Alexandrium_andersonii.AAC.1